MLQLSSNYTKYRSLNNYSYLKQYTDDGVIYTDVYEPSDI